MPSWWTGVALSVVTRPDAAVWAAMALLSALGFLAWVITCDLRTSRLRSLILAVAARRGRFDDEADGSEPLGRGAQTGGELLPGRRKGESWTSRFRRRRG